MRVTIYPLRDRHETAECIRDLIARYSPDLRKVYLKSGIDTVPVSNLSMQGFFDLVSGIPYKRDPVKPYPREIVSRPYYILQNRQKHGADCKKKAILCGAWLVENGFNYRLMGSSQLKSKQIHHIFPQVYYQGEWENFDATYPHYKLFEPKNDLTALEVLS